MTEAQEDANGTKIKVYGEAVLEFEENGTQCGMRFLESDVKKPLAAVSAMNDEGNTVVFSKKGRASLRMRMTRLARRH